MILQGRPPDFHLFIEHLSTEAILFAGKLEVELIDPALSLRGILT